MTNHLFAMFYGGPDQILPLQTGLAALLALALMFWNRLLATFHRVMARFKPQPEENVSTDATMTAGGEQSREQP